VKVTIEVVRRSDDQVIHTVETEDFKADKVMSGMRINMDTEHYRLRRKSKCESSTRSKKRS
jgi:carbamoylphosphate synthase large subunit